MTSRDLITGRIALRTVGWILVVVGLAILGVELYRGNGISLVGAGIFGAALVFSAGTEKSQTAVA